MSQGWIKLDRQITDNFLWESRPFSHGQAWIDLLLMANREDRKRIFNGEIVELKAGTVYTSILQLSHRWGWNRKKTTAFLELLEKEGMVTTKRTTQGTTLTIENWDKFQNQGTTQCTTNGTTTGQRRDTNKKVKKVKNREYIYIRPSLEAEFEDIWNLYPKKQGKAKAFDFFVKAVEAGEDVAKIRDGVERYAKYVEADGVEFRFVKMGSTFFSQKAWLDEWIPKNAKKKLDPEVKMLFTDLFTDEGEVV